MKAQLEDGYTRIANQLIDALVRIDLSNVEYRVTMVIMRQTYGFSKKHAVIELRKFTQITNLKKPHVCRALKRLMWRKIITRIGNDNYGILTTTDEWKSLPKQVTVTKIGNKRYQNRQRSLPKLVKDNKEIIKETSKESTKVPIRPNPTNQLQDYYFEKLKEKISKPVFNYGIAGKKFNELIKQGQEIEDIKKVIDNFFRVTDPFVIKLGYDIKYFASQYNAFKGKKGGKYDEIIKRSREATFGKGNT